MNNPRTRITLLIFSIVLMIASVGAYLYMRYTASSSLERTIEAKNIVSNEEARVAREKGVRQIYSSTQNDRDRVRNYFLAEGDAVPFIESLEKIGSATGASVAIGAISADNTSKLPAGSFSNIRAHVDAIGSWNAVMRTLELAEVMPFASNLSNIRLEMGESPNAKIKTPVWKLAFDINAVVIVGSLATSTPNYNKK
ncbi:MAG: hypothetical protein M1459_00280 [Patescibacteria group bacterium]|nr:hypothetical protein [Patescibacteria group bacterium]